MPTIMTFGDSNTHGTPPIVTRGLYARFPAGVRWPTVMAASLGPDWHLVEEGLPGRTTCFSDPLMGPYMDGPTGLRIALESHGPLDVLTIMLGTNDTKPQNWKHEAEFVGDYRDLIKSFQELPSKPKVYVCRPCPVPGKGNFGINEENVLKIIERLGPLIKELDCGMIDMHAALLEKAAMLPDRVHPNTAGAGEMAKAAAKAIASK